MIAEEHQEKIKKIIQDRLPERGRTLALSLTGSRTFGWGGEKYDIDIRGFVECSDWWDSAHVGLTPYDISITSWKHFQTIELEWGYFNSFYDMCKPFYIAEDFDFEGFLDLADKSIISLDTPRTQKKRANNPQAGIRSALHAYKEYLIPIYFIKTGTLESDIKKIDAEILNSKEFRKMCRKYKNKEKRSGVDWTTVSEELDKLDQDLEDLLD